MRLGDQLLPKEKHGSCPRSPVSSGNSVVHVATTRQTSCATNGLVINAIASP